MQTLKFQIQRLPLNCNRSSDVLYNFPKILQNALAYMLNLFRILFSPPPFRVPCNLLSQQKRTLTTLDRGKMEIPTISIRVSAQ
jgi:hypothetical protein